MLRWIPALLALGAAVAFAPSAPADDETDRALKALKSVTKEGKGNEDAGPAWKTLVGKGAPALLPTLEAFDEGNPTATNWLRAAVDAIAEGETAAKRPLPADKLEAFAKNTKFAPSARRVAYELLVAQDETAKDRLLPGFLNDKSPDLRRDAIAHMLAIYDQPETPIKDRKEVVETMFRFARDKDQVDLLAKKVADAGGKVSVTEHFGFVTHAALVGPFDSTDGKGFTTAYPPEGATDATGAFKGKEAEVKWGAFSTGEKYGTFDLNKLLGKHKSAAAYALAVIVAEKDTPCDVRVTCPTAVQIFVNGKKVLAHEEYHHGAPFDAMIGKANLKAGDNVLVLKVLQNNQTEAWAQVWQFQMRVCDDTGGPLPLKQKAVIDGKEQTIKLGFIPEGAEPKEEKK